MTSTARDVTITAYARFQSLLPFYYLWLNITCTKFLLLNMHTDGTYIYLLYHLPQTSKDISDMERKMNSLYQSAGLFEVNVPDYKQLKACRK